MNEQRALVVGSGGREHALAWALTRSATVREVLVAPGNGGTAAEPGMRNVAVGANDVAALVDLAREEQVDLTVIGPEGPLAGGIVDAFVAASLPVFGPTADAARIETSKSWARRFMARYDIPHPHFQVVTSVAEGRAVVDDLGGRCVVKADGLAAGKGVVVADDEPQAVAALKAMLEERKFGASGAHVLVEERLDGPELSLMVVSDGQAYWPLPPAQDHKRVGDGDRGPNTGGMGAYSPAPIAPAPVVQELLATVVEPTLEGMEQEGCRFVGCLYCGLIMTTGGPLVIEFNARFGDPETQAQMPLLTVDLMALLTAASRGDLAGVPRPLDALESAVCVVLAAHGYPGEYEQGVVVTGLTAAEARTGVKIFHAGTANRHGTVVTDGGRVVGVTGTAATLAGARAAAYGAIGHPGVQFEGMHYRRDIAPVLA